MVVIKLDSEEERNTMMATRARAAWIRTGKRILQQVKDQLESRLGPDDQSVLKYGKAFTNQVSKPWEISSKAKLIAQANAADLIFGADFHAFAQSQRLHLRILRELSDGPRVLGLECVDSEYQSEVDAYLAGKLSDSEFCRNVKWSENWGFAWNHYRPLFEFAKAKDIPILALNRRESSRTAASLNRRDQHAAKVLAKFYKKNKQHKIYVIFGDLHVASEHLPRVVLEKFFPVKKLIQKSALKPAKKAAPRASQKPAQKPAQKFGAKKKAPPAGFKVLTVFQNVDQIFFRLAKRGRALTTNVVQRGAGLFCVLNAPPWVKWQSYLLYLEHAFDLRAGEDDDLDYTDHVITMGKMLLEHLRLRRALNDLSVYSSSSLSILGTLKNHLSAREFKIATGLMERNRGFFVPSGGILYLGRPTLNQAATLFGHYIQARLSQRARMFWSMPKDFQRLIWIEAVGFFASKLLNHQRKPESLDALRIQAARSPESRDVLYLALDHSVRELAWLAGRPLRRSEFRPRERMAYYESARVLGSLLGEQLFEHFHAKGQHVAKKWFEINVEDPEFLIWYRRTVGALKPLPQILRRNDDHL